MLPLENWCLSLMGFIRQGQVGLEEAGTRATSPPVSLSPSSSLSPSGLTRSLNRGQEQSYSTGRSPMPPQCPGTQDQTYLDELVSIPKGSGVGTARLSQGGQGRGTVLQGAGDTRDHCSGEYVSWSCSGTPDPAPQTQLREGTALG